MGENLAQSLCDILLRREFEFKKRVAAFDKVVADFRELTSQNYTREIENMKQTFEQ